MRDRGPLFGETVLFTGTPKSPEVFNLVKQYGGTPISLPLIQVAEIEEADDERKMNECSHFDWLIFTSQSAVEAFRAKMLRFGFSADLIHSKIAAVGTKTAAALEKIGFNVSFIPTVFSADTFVKQFQPETNRQLNVLFLRGNLAGSLIKEELPFHVVEWTVYKTEKQLSSIGKILKILDEAIHVNILFASPSAVRIFAEAIANSRGWEGFTICAIGHVTEEALIEAGAPRVDVKPETYTLIDLVDALARRKEGL